MFIPRRMLLLATLLLSSLSPRAQAAADPSGHWEGAIHAPEMDVSIEVDLARNAKGELAGTFSNAARNVHAFPLSNAATDGASVTFAIKARDGGGMFQGSLGADGKSMNGTFTTRGPDAQPVQLPFELKRTGEAKIEAAPKSPAVSKDLEGRWTGSLDAGGTPRTIGLSVLNQPDGTSTGVVISSEGVEIPIAVIAQKGSAVTLDVKNVGGSWAGTLSAGGTELVGTWTQGGFSAPLTFRRAAAASGAAPAAPAAGNPVGRWADAVGGREKVAAIRSIYREATIAVNGVEGTIKAWHTADGKYRKEEHVATFSTIETFDGTNGTVQQGDAPPRRMAGPELERARSTPFANWNAVFFVFFPERRHGSVAIEGNDVVLKPEGGIDWRVTLDPQTSLPKTMVHQQGERTITVTFISYETIDGIRIEKEIHRSTGDPRFDSVIRFKKTVFNPPVDASLFTLDTERHPL